MKMYSFLPKYWRKVSVDYIYFQYQDAVDRCEIAHGAYVLEVNVKEEDLEQRLNHPWSYNDKFPQDPYRVEIISFELNNRT